uniref:EF hand domain containing family member A2 n=1 Tax=Echinococcus granulosus TaxID=6210 RepID=A0A068WJK9_ECHGR|nr:EF hand domain containing family member A2 [Echinococcus granulosus]
MKRFFRNALSHIFRQLRRASLPNRLYRTVAGASLFSLAVTSAHLVVPFGQKNGTSNKLLSFVPDIELSGEHVLVRLFQKFASVEVNGEAFMTPRDFIDCVTGARPPVSIKRHVIDTGMAEQLLAKTPRVSSSCGALFHTLDRSGLISCSEYLFLLSSASQCSTTIQRHFFNEDGRGKLVYKDFLKFILGLQTEVLRAEFYRFSCGDDSISPLQLAQAILRYAELPDKLKGKGLELVAESIMFEEDSIDFESYCSFFNLLFQYEDLCSALKMYMLSNRAISREEFQRAARAVTGKRMNDVIVNTVFLLFDADGDGHLSAEEFISVMRSYLARGTRSRLTNESNMQSFTSCVGTRMRAIS